MKIGGVHKFSLIDFPGKMAAVIFTQGCNFRCPFCHNGELVMPEHFAEKTPLHEVYDFLGTRIDKLDGIVITGGEPTIQKNLIPFIHDIKAMGFLVKLDTNGSRPDVLRALLDSALVDFVAMDIKAPWYKYHELTGVETNVDTVRESMMLIRDANVDYEFRTTVVPESLSPEDVKTIESLLIRDEELNCQEYIPPVGKPAVFPQQNISA